MKLKEKRQLAFLEYLKTACSLERYFYESRHKILNTPSLKGDVNSEKLSSFELIFMSIYEIQQNYKKNYSFLIHFLEQLLMMNKKYDLGFFIEIEDIKIKINEINTKLSEINVIDTLNPKVDVTAQNLRDSIFIYNEYTNEVFTFVVESQSKVNIDQFNYRKYFKDDFYKNMKTLKQLTDISRNSRCSLVFMRVSSIINALDDKNPVFQLADHFPKKT
jgi:hypothetical protein